MRISKTVIPFFAALLFCGILLFSSCEKSLISHKTSASGRMGYVPSSIPDSVADGASYALLDYSGGVTCYLHTWNGTIDLFQYLNRDVTVYGQTNTGYLSTSVKHIYVDSVKFN